MTKNKGRKNRSKKQQQKTTPYPLPLPWKTKTAQQVDGFHVPHDDLNNGGLVSQYNWILTSCQAQRVTSGRMIMKRGHRFTQWIMRKISFDDVGLHTGKWSRTPLGDRFNNNDTNNNSSHIYSFLTNWYGWAHWTSQNQKINKNVYIKPQEEYINIIL